MSDLLPVSQELSRHSADASAQAPGLRLSYGDDSGHVLGRIEYGQSTGVMGAAVQIPLQALAGSPSIERWLVSDAPRRETLGSLHLASAQGLLFGAAALGPEACTADELEEGTAEAYSQLLRLCAERGQQLVRIWNSMPDIHSGPQDLNRYMRFCKGRADAFEAHYGEDFESHLPACSAVGSHGGAPVMHFLAAEEGSTYLENPRQQSAYHYPRRYGPRSPSFARASLAPAAAGGWLMLSGTASIVGNASLHEGDVGAQTAETLRNMRVLVHGDENRPLRGHLAATKVYLRHPADLGVVRSLLIGELGPSAPVLYLHAEICRPELLVEIEGIAGAPA